MESYHIFSGDESNISSNAYAVPQSYGVQNVETAWRSPHLMTHSLSRVGVSSPDSGDHESSSVAGHTGSRCHDDYLIKSELTSPTLFRNTRRLPDVLPSNAYYLDSSLSDAIRPSNYNNYTGNSQHGVPIVIPPDSYSSPTVSRNNVSNSATSLERPLSSFSPQHVSLNNSNLSRPRSSLIHSDIKDLSAQYGIPSVLPPAPSTAPRPKPITPPSPQPQAFEDTLASYLKMLSQPEDTSPTSTMLVEPTPVQSTAPSTAPTSVSGPSDTSDIPNDISRFVESFLASPEFQNQHEFLTSPSTPFDTPYDDFATSPMDDSPFADFLNTPVIGLLDSFDDMIGMSSPSMNSGMALFPPMEGYPPSKYVDPAPPALNNLYTISPGTPPLDSLDPASLHASPSQSAVPSPARPTISLPSRRKSSGATGTRKNVTSQSLIPLDAPTQPRTYMTPSATSKKDVPAVFAKKRSRSRALGDDDDEPLPDPLPLNATINEQIEWKRRQNTLAARKSRKRKLEHTQNLEAENEKLRKENEKLRTTVEMYRQLLKTRGVDLPVDP